MRPQARPAKRLRHRRRGMADEQRPLQGQRHHLGNRAHSGFDVLGIFKFACQIINRAVKMIVIALPFLKFSH